MAHPPSDWRTLRNSEQNSVAVVYLVDSSSVAEHVWLNGRLCNPDKRLKVTVIVGTVMNVLPVTNRRNPRSSECDIIPMRRHRYVHTFSCSGLSNSG